MLQRQPAARRPHEGAADGDDGAVSPRHPSVVPEQAMQGQEALHPSQADAAATGESKCHGLYRFLFLVHLS